MTLTEAIEILQFQGAPEEGPTISAFLKAKQLLIEAGGRIRYGRMHPKATITGLLLGETEE